MNDTDAAEAHRQVVLRRLKHLEELMQELQGMLRHILQDMRRIAGQPPPE